MELSPPGFRTFIVGTSYQLGNLASSASSTIEARLGENFPLPPTKKGVKRYDYGKVICIFLACVFTYVLILTFIGPEKKDRDLDDVEETILAKGGPEVHHGKAGDIEQRDSDSGEEKPTGRHIDIESGGIQRETVHNSTYK